MARPLNLFNDDAHTIQDSIEVYLRYFGINATKQELIEAEAKGFDVFRNPEESYFTFLCELPNQIRIKRLKEKKARTLQKQKLIKEQKELKKSIIKYELYNRAGKLLGKFTKRIHIVKFLDCSNSSVSMYSRFTNREYRIVKL